MTAASSGDVSVNTCLGCAGTWVPGSSMHVLFRNYDDIDDVEQAFEEILDPEFDPGTRHCPQCSKRVLKSVEIDDTEVNFCTRCKGLFFDRGELEAVFPHARKLIPATARAEDGTVGDFIDSIVDWLKRRD